MGNDKNCITISVDMFRALNRVMWSRFKLLLHRLCRPRISSENLSETGFTRTDEKRQKMRPK